jgi:hypothetical protein
MKRLYCIALLLFASCTKPSLTVRSQTFDRTYLASYILDTPDPRKDNPQFGERLSISWFVPEKEYEKGHLELVVRIRFKKGNEQMKKIPLEEPYGHLLYPILGKEYTEHGGVLSYLITLESSGKILTQSKHKMWVDKIIPTNTEP